MILGIIGNTGKSECKTVLPDFLKWLHQLEVNFIVDEALRPFLTPLPIDYFPRNELPQHCDVVLSFGGDGTMLSTARAVGGAGVPILGVNLGGLGYLTEVSPEALKSQFRDFLDGKYVIENHMMLEAEITTNGETEKYFALNDIVVDKGAFTRIIRLRTTIDGEYFNTYAADGLIISTAIGSTGYSLSAGGPILEPTMQGIIIIPICPHTLAHRPVVISSKKTIEIEADPVQEKQNFSCDGFMERYLHPGMRVRVRRSDRVVRLIRMKGHIFFKVLREKLNWGI